MVKAYRDTWELGLHSYLSYMRDRLLLARELLTPSGSVFVQISDENVHHLRELLDEVFEADNFVSLISYSTSGGFPSKQLSRAGDYVLWYSKDLSSLKYRALFEEKRDPFAVQGSKYDQLELPSGERRPLTSEEKLGVVALPRDSRIFRYDNTISQGASRSDSRLYTLEGCEYDCGPNSHWKASVPDGMDRLARANRLVPTSGGKLGYVRYFSDFPLGRTVNLWPDVGGSVQSRSDEKIYAVQTGVAVVQRCVLMSTDPGDLVLDPTCGSGTTAYVAEQWGRRWVAIDVSRVPLALARQRLLTATLPYHQLQDEARGPVSGFVYKRKQNKKGEEVGGIVPHITLKSIAHDEPPEEEVLVDRPEEDKKIVRVTGPFCVEATIPTPMDWDAESDTALSAATADQTASFEDRMLEVLRKSPVLHLAGNKTVTLKNVRRPAKTLSLSAEAGVEATSPGQRPTLTEAIDEADDKRKGKMELTVKPVAILFGPENGAVSERAVSEAAREAQAKHYTHLYVIGFAIQPNARKLIEECDKIYDIPATYVQATPDLLMGDLLKNMRSSQIFSVCGLPDINLRKVKSKKGEASRYEVELLGLDVFDPIEMKSQSRTGDDVPAWFLDTDYNGLSFHVCQAFFPRTSAWDSLRKALKGQYDDTVWEHLRGTTSVPFEAGEHGQIAVKVIDDRGNELLVTKSLAEVEG